MKLSHIIRTPNGRLDYLSIAWLIVNIIILLLFGGTIIYIITDIVNK